MLCALCKQREANKKNTHYLTDAIIRSCLNIDGSKDRDKGLLFDLSNTKPFVDYKIQRSTPPEKVEAILGQAISEEKIEEGRERDYAVDDIFCSECEKIFTEIENDFVANILPQLRNINLDGVSEKGFQENKIIRLFFCLQIWRSYICEAEFELSPRVADRLRSIILNYEIIEEGDLNDFPFFISYLQTTGGQDEATTNAVGFHFGRNPSIILMCDFIVLFYESIEQVDFFDLRGLFIKADFGKYINCKEKDFIIKVVSNAERKAFNLKNAQSKLFPLLKEYVAAFVSACETNHKQPTMQLWGDYLKAMAAKPGIEKLTEEGLLNLTAEFFRGLR